MNETKMIGNKFVMNEYLDVVVKRVVFQLCSDCYQALGWTIVNTSTGIDSVTLKLQRDRKIKNRTALCDLQRKCEATFSTIEKLEGSKTMKAMAVAIGVGLLGTAAMVGAVLAYLASMIPICIILVFPGLIGWGLPYFLYNKYIIESTTKVNLLLDRNYDVIYEACEKASKLLE